jgi:hypothetical protein
VLQANVRGNYNLYILRFIYSYLCIITAGIQASLEKEWSEQLIASCQFPTGYDSKGSSNEWCAEEANPVRKVTSVPPILTFRPQNDNLNIELVISHGNHFYKFVGAIYFYRGHFVSMRWDYTIKKFHYYDDMNYGDDSQSFSLWTTNVKEFEVPANVLHRTLNTIWYVEASSEEAEMLKRDMAPGWETMWREHNQRRFARCPKRPVPPVDIDDSSSSSSSSNGSSTTSSESKKTKKNNKKQKNSNTTVKKQEKKDVENQKELGKEKEKQKQDDKERNEKEKENNKKKQQKEKKRERERKKRKTKQKK